MEGGRRRSSAGQGALGPLDEDRHGVAVREDEAHSGAPPVRQPRDVNAFRDDVCKSGVGGGDAVSASSCRSFRIPASTMPAGANLRSNRTRRATPPAVYRSFGLAAAAASSPTSASTPLPHL